MKGYPSPHLGGAIRRATGISRRPGENAVSSTDERRRAVHAERVSAGIRALDLADLCFSDGDLERLRHRADVDEAVLKEVARGWKRPRESSEVEFDSRRFHCIFCDAMYECRRAAARRRESLASRERKRPRESREVEFASRRFHFCEAKWEPGRRASASLPAVARATGGSERGLGAFPTRRRSHLHNI